MENSSKALLISGTILLTLILISLGINFFNSTSNMSQTVDTNSQSVAASTFNSQFLSYLSNSASGSEAKELILKILKHNATVSSSSDFSADSHQVYLNYYSAPGSHGGHYWKTTELQNVYNLISDSSKYKIFLTEECGLYPGAFYNGYVICIAIMKK